MKKYFNAAGVFLRAMPQFLLFELMYKLLLTALGIPLISELFGAVMKVAGISYISMDGLPALLKSPFTYLAAFLMLFLVAFFSFVEISALIACFAGIRKKKKVTVLQMLTAGLKTFGKAFRGTGILRFLAFMLFVPLAQFTLSSGVFFAPLSTLMRSLIGTHRNWVFIALFALLILGIVLLLVSRCYTIHYLMLTGSRFSECSAKSRLCLKGKKISTALSIFLWSVCIIAAAAVITFGLSFLVILIIKGFGKPETAFFKALGALEYAGKVFAAISAFFASPMILCCLTEKFYSDTIQEEHITVASSEMKRFPKPVRIIASVTVTALCFALNFSYIQSFYKGNTNLNLGLFTAPQITAHRGFSAVAPENTSYAFEKAISIGADYIEFDVQQTADGQLVVFHDRNISRTTNGVGELSSYTYDELLKFSNGSWFDSSGTYDDSRILLLSETLELIGRDALLNIEIKDFGDTSDTAVKIVELIEEYNLTNSCYITSFDYSALKTVKKTNPKIKTGLITNAASAAVYSKLKYIDAISLNYLFINRNVVSAAHKNGKKVFAWTVNRTSDMQQLLALGVDNIITDRPDKAAEMIYSYSGSDAVLNILRQIFGTQ